MDLRVNAMHQAAAPRIVLAAPAEVERRVFYRALSTTLLLGLAIGVQAMLTAFVLWGPEARDDALLAGLTARARRLMRPEHDLAIYVLGIFATLAFTIGLTLSWQRGLRKVDASRLRQYLKLSTLARGGLAAAACCLYAAVLFVYYPHQSAEKVVLQTPGSLHGFILFLPILLTILGLAGESFLVRAVVSRSRHDVAQPAPARSAAESPSAGGPVGAAKWRFVGPLLDVAVPLGLFLILLIPPSRWSGMAGRLFVADGFQHWSFYAMGPALAYRHGAALCRDVYSQYGVGWPLLFSCLPGADFSYRAMLGTGILCACIYFAMVYFLARSLFRSSAWAAVALIAAVSLQFFGGMADASAGAEVWRYPSSTILRNAFDVWFFMGLLGHLRSGRLRWLVLAGIACGFGVAFGTDAGIYLVVTFVWYLIVWLGAPRLIWREDCLRKTTVAGGVFLAMAGLIVFLTALAANQWQLPGGAYWRGWAESLGLYAVQGLGFLPIAAVSKVTMAGFAVVLAVYIGTILFSLLHLLSGGRRAEIALLGCMSVYGLQLMLLFVGRSVPEGLLRPIIPFVITAIGLCWLGAGAAGWRGRNSLVPAVVLAGVVACVLLTHAPGMMRSYPNLLHRADQSLGSGDLYLVDHDVRVPPAAAGQPPYTFEAVLDISAALRKLAPRDDDVAIFDYEDTLIYYATNLKPWSRYATLFHSLQTRDQRQAVIEELLARRPSYVVLREPTNPSIGEFLDTWTAFYDVVRSRYVKTDVAGGFGIWRLP